jgi:hypothetical protein
MGTITFLALPFMFACLAAFVALVCLDALFTPADPREPDAEAARAPRERAEEVSGEARVRGGALPSDYLSYVPNFRPK